MTTVIICHFQTVLGVRQGNCPHHSEEGSTEMEGERMNFCDGCIIKEARIPNPQHFNLGGEGSILLFLTLLLLHLLYCSRLLVHREEAGPTSEVYIHPNCSIKPHAAAAAKSLQSCLTLCDSIDGSPPGSPVPGILQARTLEWVAISFSNA